MTSARVVIEADGGSRGNPGPAGYGAVVRDADSGALLAERAGAIGVATNNVAEYQGLIAGLRAAAEVAPDAELEVRMDSKLVVEQMSGRWKIKHPSMRPLAAEAAGLATARPSSVRYRWIPRERNKDADRLANEAMDAAAAGRVWEPSTTPPLGPPAARGSASVAAGVPSDSAPADRWGSALAGQSPDPTPVPAPTTRRLSGWVAPPAPATWTVLLRHGQTPVSIEKRFGGTVDAPLTEVGHAQAAAAAERLRGEAFDAVISSPLKRARQTAEAAYAGLVPAPGRDEVAFVVDEQLRETDFGAWEGLTFAEARERDPGGLSAWLADPAVPPPGGESLAATIERVDAALAAHRAAFPGGRLLVVTHMGPIKSAASLALAAGPAVFYRLHLDLASLTTIAWYSDGPAVLHAFNDVSHLPTGSLADE
ncbi:MULTISPECIES: bifunctional RNase H/acid phosphatase [unclassified Pseudofrankia]|uniref:bifunctional RNase H/acid phosphatase n=1 Tax=unclassified Pseudofrankia TaxID=2994372 RepID=UPI0008D935C5|nr:MULTISPECIES: bifunctional RNase H/acid phosphatase [unclassified Pseudofrankia]MDT3443456.1 bifunctional RNase H/acid phosphatase [Pseudofrankia sp. BMG5.37]OHV45351.1 bifunctional RNase H/acid phosphatase [Pseudofrankia sp. BMG5.36]